MSRASDFHVKRPERTHYDASLDAGQGKVGRETLCGHGSLRTNRRRAVTCGNCKRILARLQREYDLGEAKRGF